MIPKLVYLQDGGQPRYYQPNPAQPITAKQVVRCNVE